MIIFRGAYESVAPYMGAWIETGHGLHDLCVLVVAPYMGAWIETLPPTGKQ